MSQVTEEAASSIHLLTTTLYDNLAVITEVSYVEVRTMQVTDEALVGAVEVLFTF